MEKRLKGLKKAMEKTYMQELEFTSMMRKNIHDSIAKEGISEQDILISLLELLAKERTGFELTALLQSRGIRKYDGDEGSLYTLLHEQEHRGIIASSWSPAGEKYYHLTDKGRRVLEKTSKRASSIRFSFREQSEG